MKNRLDAMKISRTLRSKHLRGGAGGGWLPQSCKPECLLLSLWHMRPPSLLISRQCAVGDPDIHTHN